MCWGFLPRVTWVEGDTRRELDYFSDVMAQIDWQAVNTEALCADWTPDPRSARAASQHRPLDPGRTGQG